MRKKISARERFRAVFEHNTSELDRLPILHLDTPPQGLYFQEWEKMANASDDIDDFVRITKFGDKTCQKYINSEWFSFGFTYPKGYAQVPLPPEHPLWEPYDKEKVKLSINPFGCIMVHGSKMHGIDYSWYLDGYFCRQKQPDGTILEPHEVRERFYEKYGKPWDDQFGPSEQQKKVFRDNLIWYEQNYNNFSEDGLSDFALFCNAGSLFEHTWEGMGSAQPTFSIMHRKYPGQLQAWLHDIKEMIMRNVREQIEIAEEVDAQIDVFWFWDDSGQKGRPIIHPDIHRKYFVPLYKEITDYIHKKGAFAQIHSCGHGEQLLDNWIEAGIDAWQTVERAALNDPARIREKVKNKLILVGAIDASNVLTFADSVDEVIQHTKDTIKDSIYTPDDACYIPGFTHDLLDTPVKNVRASVDTILKYATIDELKKLKNW